MTSYFCISVRFLQPFCHARGDGDEPEWPPSPLRLFQALVAAAAARWNERMRLEYSVPALRWLEGLPKPQIVAVPGRPSQTSYRLYVPDNIGDKVAASWTRGGTADIAEYRTEKDVCSTILDGDAVHYLFPAVKDDPELVKHKETLVAAARSITQLGWGIDMVAAEACILTEREAANIAGQRWLPTEDSGAVGLRVPVKGTLDDLNRKHHDFLHRLARDARGNESFSPVPPLSAFRVVGYRRASASPTHRYAAFRLRHPMEDRAAVFATTRANHVAAMTRHATAKLAQEQGRQMEWIDSYVHGHRGETEQSLPRFSYLPLPSIERRPDHGVALGSIRRILLGELMESSESHLRWSRQMLPGQFLNDDKTGDRKAMLAPLTGIDWVLQQYVGTLDTWATVSPVILPGSDEGKFTKTEKLFFKALRHAGYSPEALTELEFRNVSFWPGGELALKFQRPDYLKKNHWSVYHVRLRWRNAVAGPIAIGAGRHCGLGIFAASA